MNIRKRNISTTILLLGFILGTHQGYIALWKDGNAKPIRVFPYSASSLPTADRQALEQGIPIESRDDLLRLLEDYLS